MQRTPLQQFMTKAIDWLTFGKFSEFSKKMGYDKYFHLAMLVTVACEGSESRKLITVEKNHVLNISTATKNSKDAE